MNPLLFHNEYIIIDSYSILFFLAWTIAGLLFYYFIKQKKLNVETMLTILCGCALGALFGSFVFNIILFGQEEFLSKLYNLDFNGMSGESIELMSYGSTIPNSVYGTTNIEGMMGAEIPNYNNKME